MAKRDADPLMTLIRAIVAGDLDRVEQAIARSPELARQAATIGATRENAEDYFFREIRHYVYGGDTALHMAAAAHRVEIARSLIDKGASLGAKNRRGAEPLHYAVDGGPRAPTWNPEAQQAIVELLIGAGADVNAVDKGGVTPLHRAVRNRCAMAVRALLALGADARRKNNSGSTPLDLAKVSSGKSGSGTPEAKEQQAEILKLLSKRH
jgi:hypothetical protein